MLAIKIYIERKGKKQLKISPILLFRGFLQELLENKNEIIERHLEKISITEQIQITIIKFRDTINKSIRTALVVANYHPGPLLTIGSSALPSKLQKTIQDKFGFPIFVPHGISGHERNLVSQKQNEKVISKVIKLLDENCQWGGITKPIEVKHDNATAHCQIFNNCALTTLTLAPDDVEDIPLEVEDEVFQYSKKFFKNSILIDAHNSISKMTILSKQDLTNLITVAKIAIRKASLMKEFPFRIGIAEIHLNDFQLKQGIGPGGGFILLLEIDHNYFSYIIIDGNNMIKGLREQIHKALRNISINPVETMTTDTHIVSGRTSSELGYFPVGAVISHKDLIDRILNAAEYAKQSLIEVETSYITSHVKVKTLGLEFFSKLVSFMYTASRFIAFSTIPLIVFSGYLAYLFTY
jgi:putative membrane protein